MEPHTSQNSSQSEFQIKENLPTVGHQNLLSHIPDAEVTNGETLQAYLNAMKYSNLVHGHSLLTRNVRIYEKDHVHEIYTSSNKKLPHLVMLHGYGGTALTFVRIFEYLRSDYQVHALDHMGIGLSSLGNYSEKFTDEETKNYYIEALEQWRVKMGITKFTLVGHSFGGYLSTLYSEKYPQNVQRLVLLSPAGATSKSQEEIDAELKAWKRGTLGQKVWTTFIQSLYNINVRPSSLIKSWFLGKTVLDKFTDRLNLEGDQKQAWTNYLLAIARRPSSSETGFYKLFGWPIRPKRSIEDIVADNKFKFPIEFYFGSHDWMDKEGGRRLASKYSNVKYEIVPNAGHQLIFNNPLGVVAKILRTDRNDRQVI